MIVKSTEFDNKLTIDLHWLNINRKVPLKIKGSYIVKSDGDILSDIDIQATAFFNENILKIINKVIDKNKNKNSPFTFIHMIVGKYEEFKLPWLIDNEGGCYYNVYKTKNWFLNFKEQNLVPESILNIVEENLFASKISINNLINVEFILYKYSDILWTQYDIYRGYKIIRGRKYILLEEMKTESPVMEFVYGYNKEYINIDFALFDRRYRAEPIGKMYPYYSNNFYKIMKLFRWKIDSGSKKEYFETMKKVEMFIAVKYQIDTIENIQLHIHEHDKIHFTLKNIYKNLSQNLHKIGLKPGTRGLEYINNILDSRINDVLKDSVYYFLTKVSCEDEREKMKKFLALGMESQKKVSQEELEKRSSKGILCPFFPGELKDYDDLSSIAKKLNIKEDIIFDCFSKVADDFNITLKDIIDDTYPKNNLSIMIMDDNQGKRVVLKNLDKVVGVYDTKYLDPLRRFIMIKT